MQITSIIPYFVLTISFLGFAYCIYKIIPFYHSHISMQEERFQSIEGLRGFLALGVFFHHSVISYFYYKTGEWNLPPSQFYTMLGQVGVAIFFVITGFLFWLKMLNSNGKIHAWRLYLSRFKRLAPMYYFSVLLVVVIVLAFSRFKLNVPLSSFIEQVINWCGFAFLPRVDINQLKNTFIINSVYWTLTYEWVFYLALPLLVFMRKGLGFLVLVILLMMAIHHGWLSEITLEFLVGAVAALVIKYIPADLSKKRYSLIPIIAIVIVFWHFKSGYGLYQPFFYLVFFLFIIYNSTLWGLLTSVQARLLGKISYSVYLLHSPILYTVLRIVNHYQPIADINPILFWCVIALIGVITILLSSITYCFIEFWVMSKI